MNMAEEISIATCHHEQYLAHCCSLVKDIGCEMISVLASSAVDRVFEPQSGQTKDYTIGISYFSAKHASLGRKSKDWIMCPRGRDPRTVISVSLKIAKVGVKQQSPTHSLKDRQKTFFI